MSKNVRTTLLQLSAVVVAIAGALVLTPSLVNAQSAYGTGSYGTCTYNSCGITLGSSGTVSLNITPAGGTTKCTTASDQVQVTTDSSTGYTLTMSDVDTTTVLNNGSGGTIPSTTSTQASPSVLVANKWGYRVDSIAGFGAGPTSGGSNTGIPAVTFALIPSSSGAADTLAATSVAADPAVSTYVWYGACVNATTTAGTYSDSVVYTAVVN